MARNIVYQCDSCGKECKGNTSAKGCLVIREFTNDKPIFTSFCSWNCLWHWLNGHIELHDHIGSISFKNEAISNLAKV